MSKHEGIRKKTKQRTSTRHDDEDSQQELWYAWVHSSLTPQQQPALSTQLCSEANNLCQCYWLKYKLLCTNITSEVPITSAHSTIDQNGGLYVTEISFTSEPPCSQHKGRVLGANFTWCQPERGTNTLRQELKYLTQHKVKQSQVKD